MQGVSEWAGYEKVSGRIQFAHSAYNYVEMRVTPTAIYLTKGNIIHAENINDIPIPNKEHVPYGKNTIIDNLNFVFVNFEFNSPFKSAEKPMIQPVSQTTFRSADIPEQPPKYHC